MKNNPFSLSFGKEPVSLINRNVQSYEIIDTFEDENPAYQVCMITGVRGSGKTVMLTEINKLLGQRMALPRFKEFVLCR